MKRSLLLLCLSALAIVACSKQQSTSPSAPSDSSTTAPALAGFELVLELHAEHASSVGSVRDPRRTLRRIRPAAAAQRRRHRLIPARLRSNDS